MRTFVFGCGLCALSLISVTGCALCDVGDLCSYSAVGGKWQRSDPACGRVGSVFSDADARLIASGEHSSDFAPAAMNNQTIDDPYYDSSAITDESIQDDAVSLPEGVIILGDEDFSS